MPPRAKAAVTPDIITDTPSGPPIEFPRIEDADADNAMITPGGDRFFPDSLDDALTFAREHDAIPQDLTRWPWSWIEGWPTAERKTHCPTPDVCFPYGFGTGYHGCIHGETYA